MCENSDKITYDPADKTSVAYFINNRISEYIDTSFFQKHEIEVPVYKDKIIYGEEISKKKYTVLLAAPDMYEMFSAQSSTLQGNISLSYWLRNTSQAERIGAAVYDAGVPVNEKINSFDQYGIRVEGFIKGDSVINRGNGTLASPYKLR